MYKGRKKTVLVFKGDSRIFDEAQFIVREDNGAGDEDILKEANRIISEYGNYTSTCKKTTKNKNGSTFWYIMGLVSGGAGAIISMIAFNLLNM